MKTKKMHNGNKAKTASLTVFLVSVFLLSTLAGVQFVGKVSAAGPYDWPMHRHDLQHSGYSASPAPSTNQTLWTYTTGGGVWSSPAVADGKVYVGSDENKVYCLDAASGAYVWNYTTGGDMWSSPAVAGGKVYVGSLDDKVYCLNVADGALLWSYTTGSDVISSPAVVDGRVYVGSNDTNVYALNAATGALIWNYSTGHIVVSAPAVADGKVYAGSRDDKVYCLNAATGAFIWSYTTGGDVWCAPAVVDGKVYVSSGDANIYALNASTGVLIWNFPTGDRVYSSPAVVGGRVYVGSWDNKTYCLDAATGSHKWNFTTGGSIWDSSPAVADGKVYIGSNDGKVYCLNAANGALVWSYKTGMIVGSSPAVANGVVYVGSYDRKVYAFSSSPPISVSGWSKTYGGTGDDRGEGETVQTSDGGYAIAGYTTSFGAGGQDFWLLKTDANGNIQWNKTYGGALDEICGVMCQTNDGGYAMAGYTKSFGAGSQDFWLVKADASGSMQWNKTYGGTGDEYALSVVQTSDGGYAMAGVTNSFGAGSNDFWLVKTDPAGTMQWNKTYGGANNDYGYGLVQTSDGGYAVAGYTRSFGAGSDDFWLVKADANGIAQWNKTYGGTGMDWAVYLVQTNDGGYALPGFTTSFGGYKAYLVKTDASGSMQWNKTYGGTTEVAHHGIQTADGGYALGGWNFMAGGGFLLIKTDASGNMLWKNSYGGTSSQSAYSVAQTSDEGYVLTGNTNNSASANSDLWLIKTDAFGVVPEGLTIGVIMLLSSIAALIGTIYFRKPPRITK